MTRLQLERAQVWHCVAAIAVGGTAGLLWPPTGNSFVVLPFAPALPPEWRLAGAVTRETYGRAFGFERMMDFSFAVSRRLIHAAVGNGVCLSPLRGRVNRLNRFQC